MKVLTFCQGICIYVSLNLAKKTNLPPRRLTRIMPTRSVNRYLFTHVFILTVFISHCSFQCEHICGRLKLKYCLGFKLEDGKTSTGLQGKKG